VATLDWISTQSMSSQKTIGMSLVDAVWRFGDGGGGRF
jgi:hypothetical protein